uniref:CSON010251 protein n=1 Tax=Culicoides sonorensis TaxID=179676 RepID=A0A336LED5_CULSO
MSAQCNTRNKMMRIPLQRVDKKHSVKVNNFNLITLNIKINHHHYAQNPTAPNIVVHLFIERGATDFISAGNCFYRKYLIHYSNDTVK